MAAADPVAAIRPGQLRSIAIVPCDATTTIRTVIAAGTAADAGTDAMSCHAVPRRCNISMISHGGRPMDMVLRYGPSTVRYGADAYTAIRQSDKPTTRYNGQPVNGPNRNTITGYE